MSCKSISTLYVWLRPYPPVFYHFPVYHFNNHPVNPKRNKGGWKSWKLEQICHASLMSCQCAKLSAATNTNTSRYRMMMIFGLEKVGIFFRGGHEFFSSRPKCHFLRSKMCLWSSKMMFWTDWDMVETFSTPLRRQNWFSITKPYQIHVQIWWVFMSNFHYNMSNHN